ncbi:MAG: right-handed parallel beta-helix repeat-containing protein [Candidatus Thorarchaeota archaeon]
MTLFLFPATMNVHQTVDSLTPIDNIKIAWIETSPFNITHNDNFTSLGFPGSGTEEDPYKIENLSIVEDGDCIDIRNTDAHFVISECYFGSETHEYDSIFDDSAGAGVILRNASNCRIIDCWFQYKYYGCFLWYLTSNCSITDSIFEHCFRYGIFTVGSSHGEISENTFSRNFTGIGLHGGGGWGSTYYFNVSYNTFMHNSYGVDGNAARHSIIAHNNFESGGAGIYGWHYNTTITNNQLDSLSFLGIDLGIGSSGLIQYNEITNIGGIGLDIHGVNNLTISHNLIEYCSTGIDAWGESTLVEWNNISYNWRGFELQSADNFTIRNNLISHNEGYGLYFGYAENSSIYYNTIINNNYANARDDGKNNTWDDGISRGNVWDDYIGFGSYVIPGGAGSTDRYPDNPGHGLRYDVILPPIGISIISIVGIVLLYQKRDLVVAKLKIS